MASDRVMAYFVRHGETSMNAEKRFRGSVDVPLDAAGQAQALELRDFFATRPHGVVSHTYRQRTRQTADVIAQGLTYGHPELQALNVGDFTGQPKTQLNVSKLRVYTEQHHDEPIPGGESLNSFRSRIRPTVEEIVEKGYADKPPIAVVHSSIIHEIGNIYNGNHLSALVHPGGVTAVMRQSGTGSLYAKAIRHPLLKDEDFTS